MNNEEPSDKSGLVPSAGGSLSNPSPGLVRRGLDSLHVQQLRTLHFPPDRSLGTLFQHDIQGNTFCLTPLDVKLFLRGLGREESVKSSLVELSRKLKVTPEKITSILNKVRSQRPVWKVLAEASGDIEVSCSENLVLSVRSEDSIDLSPLDLLKANDLSGLVLYQALEIDRGLVHIRNLTGLLHLDLCGSSVTDIGLMHIENLTSLVYLDLSNTAVTDEGVKHLMYLSSLYSVYLEETMITDVGLQQLVNVSTLQYVRVQGSKVTMDGVGELERALPNCHADIEVY